MVDWKAFIGVKVNYIILVSPLDIDGISKQLYSTPATQKVFI
jgi:hypothetical protein